MQTQSVAATSVRGRVDPLLRQTHATFPRMRSIWFRECGQDLWTVCKGVVYNSNSHEQTGVEAAKVRTWLEAGVLTSLVSASLRTTKQWPHSLQALRFEHVYVVPAVPAHFASGHVVHVANLKPPQPFLFAVSGAVDCETGGWAWLVHGVSTRSTTRRREAWSFRERLS